jgi:hypothetical protein
MTSVWDAAIIGVIADPAGCLLKNHATAMVGHTLECADSDD